MRGRLLLPSSRSLSCAASFIVSGEPQCDGVDGSGSPMICDLTYHRGWRHVFDPRTPQAKCVPAFAAA